jgi:dTDP-4-dehydrorhamnose 3,5-epimerase
VSEPSIELPEVLRIAPRVHRDDRGRFFEFHRADRAAGGVPSGFVQDNVSISMRGVVRGLHAQHPKGQGKLVSVVRGRIFDVAVDLRQGSPRFGRWMGVELGDDRHEQLYIPPGFAHGFLALTDEAIVLYKCTAPYDPASEFAVRWDDPAIGIQWPLTGMTPVLSPKDAAAPLLADLPRDRLPVHGVDG